MSLSPPIRRLTAVVALLMLFAAVIGWLSWQNLEKAAPPAAAAAVRAQPEARSTAVRPAFASAASRRARAEPDDAAAVPAFRTWLGQYQAAPESERAALVNRGKALAAQRRVRMARLIRENPRQALAEALTLDQYAALPEALKTDVERPYSETARYDHHPVCNAPAGMPGHVAQVRLSQGEFAAFTFGQREQLMSKRAVPVQGITLDDAAAVHDAALRALDPAEIATARELFPSAQQEPARSFVTGEPIVGEPVVALGGGKLYYMADKAELKELNNAIAELEALPGPDAGSDVLHYAFNVSSEDNSSPPAQGNGGFNFNAAQAASMNAASAWTTTVKKVFLIRVNFSDLDPLPFTEAAVESSLNGPVSDLIRSMSYGKTWIEGSASANIYEMPESFSEYYGDTPEKNNAILRDARNKFRNSRHGADASVNIGEVSDTGSGGDSGLGDYDIVGVLYSATRVRNDADHTMGGIAGGNDMWMRGSIDTVLFAHEFGHNYGLNHSNFWQTKDGSIMGAGYEPDHRSVSVEYGDDFDIMGKGGAEGHFNVQGKARLDWLTTSQWIDATASGSNTYRIYRLDDPLTTGTPRGMRITRSAVAGSEEYLWAGYRPAYSRFPRFARGAYLQWQRPGEIRSDLLDMTPATSGVKTDAGLVIGQTFADATSNAFVTPLGVGGTGADSYLDVRVNFGPFPANTAPVAGAISGPSTVSARSAVTLAASASDANGDTLAYHWDFGDGSVRDNAPSVTQTWIVGGTYTVNLTVSDMKGGTHAVSKTVTVTDPLDTWTAGTVGGSNPNLADLVHGKGRFIAADSWSDSIHTSWDGVTWTNEGGLPDMDHAKLAFGANVFVAAGTKNSDSSKAQVCWSTDGRRWYPVEHLFDFGPMTTITYGDGRFIALGNNGQMLLSVDGKTWTGATMGALANFRHVVWSGTGWVALAANPASTSGRPNIVWTSPDASGWTNRGPVAAEDFKDVYKLRSFGGICYALGRYVGIRYSTDSGVTWQDSNLPPGTRWTTLDLARAPDGPLVAPSRETDVSGEPGALLVSADGIQWARSNGNADVGLKSKTMVYGAGSMVSIEDNGGIRRSASLYPGNSSPNASFTSAPTTGSARQLISFNATGTDGDGHPLTYVWDFGPQFDMQDGGTSAMFFPFGGTQSVTVRILDGCGGIATLNHSITVADPARTFTDRVSNTTGRFNAIASGGGRAVAVGAGVFAWSTDGTAWTSGTRNNTVLHAITYDGSKFIAVGEEYNFTSQKWEGRILSSTDGATWTGPFHQGGVLRAIAVGSRYIAVGDAGQNGEIVQSENGGVDWNVATSQSFSHSVFHGLSWSGSTFLLTGLNGQAWTSNNGQGWEPRSSNLKLQNWQTVRENAWLHDRFVTSGWYSKLLVSTSNGESFTTTRKNAEDLDAYAYGAGIYFTAGVDRSNSDADVDVMSLDGNTWYSYPAGTTTDRFGASFFNNTFITVGDSGSIRQSGVVSPSSAAYGSWYATNFPASGVNSLPDADPDNDGISNFAEYALNLPAGRSTGAVTEGTAQGGRGWIKFTLPAPARPDIRYVVEGCPTLGSAWTTIASKDGEAAWTWQAGGTQRMSIGAPAGGSSIVEIGNPDGQGDRYFFRLRMESL
ncbi:MAG: PKD domain-containing protein [Prosthecobacter sp.]